MSLDTMRKLMRARVDPRFKEAAYLEEPQRGVPFQMKAAHSWELRSIGLISLSLASKGAGRSRPLSTTSQALRPGSTRR